jgi:hypothetical protein
LTVFGHRRESMFDGHAGRLSDLHAAGRSRPAAVTITDGFNGE